MFKEFKTFIARGSAIDLAVGIVIGTAFTNIVNSLVKDVIMPPIGLLLGQADFSALYLNLSGKHYPSYAAAQAAGAAIISYGVFLNAVIDFFIVAFIVFLAVRQINRLRKPPVAPPPTQACPYCLTQIPVAASRCPSCTSDLPANP